VGESRKKYGKIGKKEENVGREGQQV